MAEREHLTDAELMALLDDEALPQSVVQISAHLDSCELCRNRWHTFELGDAGYQAFHKSMLKAALDGKGGEPLLFERRPLLRPKLLWSTVAAAAALIVIAFLLVSTNAQSRRATDLLARAAHSSSPAHEQIKVTLNGASWLRPANLSGATVDSKAQRVRALFVQAKYDWNHPLSATSFAVWRRQLPHRRDHVSTVGTASGVAAYLIRTDTPDSSLHSAGLTLRRADLVPIQGEFRFEENQVVELTDAGVEALAVPRSQHMQEAPITPSDELRVLAALDRIGADVHDSITVERQSDAVVVTGIGVRPSREEEIRRTLRAIPRTVLHFLSHAHAVPNSGSAVTAEEANAETHHLLELQAGGPDALESMTTQALEASTDLLAQAHALAVLAAEFPPQLESRLSPSDRSTLLQIAGRHAANLNQSVAQLQTTLKPLLPRRTISGTPSTVATSWQSEAAKLYASAHTIDGELARLLASAYRPDEAQKVLIDLPDEMDQLRKNAASASGR